MLCTLHLKKNAKIGENIWYYLALQNLKEQNQFLLYWSGISKFVMGFTLSNILFELCSLEKPYPYKKSPCKQGYSSTILHLLMQ